MEKRGATVLNYVLMIGLLLVGVIVITSLRSILAWQGRQELSDVSQDYFDIIHSAVESANAISTDTMKNVSFQDVPDYSLQIKHNSITARFLEDDFERPLLAGKINYVPASIEGSAKILLSKQGIDLIVTQEYKCDKSDNICDPGCTALDLGCDPACLSDIPDGICLMNCIDIDGDRIISSSDRDDLCDPDCYDHSKDGGAYDYDCLASYDGICDPDTHMLKDGYCDLDCLDPDHMDGVCDLDCLRGDADCP